MKFFAKESTTVGLWHFEEISGSTHSDGSGNAYTISDLANAPLRITTANFGGGLSFDGIDDASRRTGTATALEVNTLTIEVLMRCPSTFSSGVVYWYAPQGAHNDGRGVSMGITSEVKPYIQVGFADGSWKTLAASQVLPVDRWFYVAGSFDGTGLRIYVCGTLLGTLSAPGTISYENKPGFEADFKGICLGHATSASGNGTPAFFGKSQIADLRISNMAKSDAQIVAEQAAQEFCEVEPKVTLSEIAYGMDASFPAGPYHRYKTIRAQVEMLNNLVLGP